MKLVADAPGLPSEGPLCLFGAGQGGRLLLAHLEAVGRIDQIRGVLDNSHSGQMSGIPVLSPLQALERGWQGVPVIIASQYWNEIAAQLTQLGFTTLFNAHPLITTLQRESARTPGAGSVDEELMLRLGYGSSRALADVVLASPHLKPLRGWFPAMYALSRAAPGTTVCIVGIGRSARRYAALAGRMEGIRVVAFVDSRRRPGDARLEIDDVPVLAVEELPDRLDRDCLIVGALSSAGISADRLRARGFHRLVDMIAPKGEDAEPIPAAAPAAVPWKTEPLVSVMVICRNAAATLRRAIDSVLAQDYSNIEYIIQDGASDDGTLEIIDSYRRDPYWRDRIRLVSERDGSVCIGLVRALRRCRGDIIASCMSDEELLPDAVSQAVAAFREHPDSGAITGNSFTTDCHGATIGVFTGAPFNIVEYLFGEYCPYFPASFFSRRALEDIGLYNDDWNEDVIEFELWCRLATRHRIAYVDQIFCKYAIHDQQLSNVVKHIRAHFFERTEVLTRLFSVTGFFGPLENGIALWEDCIARQYALFFNHVLGLTLPVEELGVPPKVAAVLPIRLPPPKIAVYDAIADLYDRRGFTREALAIRQSIPASVRGAAR